MPVLYVFPQEFWLQNGQQVDFFQIEAALDWTVDRLKDVIKQHISTTHQVEIEAARILVVRAEEADHPGPPYLANDRTLANCNIQQEGMVNIIQCDDAHLPVNGIPWREPEPEQEELVIPEGEVEHVQLVIPQAEELSKIGRRKPIFEKPQPVSPKVETQKLEPEEEIPEIIIVEEDAVVEEKSRDIVDDFHEDVEQAEADLENSPDELSWHSIYNQMVVNDQTGSLLKDGRIESNPAKGAFSLQNKKKFVAKFCDKAQPCVLEIFRGHLFFHSMQKTIDKI